jgi:plastocyanin
VFSVAADDSTPVNIDLGETVQFIGGAGITTETDAEGNVTITNTVAGSSFDVLTDAANASLTIDKIYEPAIAMLRVDNVGTASYTFPSHYSGNNPTIYALSGTTIAFDLTAIPGHPFEIQDALGDLYNTGLVHISITGTVSTGASAQGKDSGTLYWRIPENISGGYRYQCQNHASMVGAITVKRLSII